MNIQKIKALIVDDNLEFSKVFKKTLESKNCEVTTVTDPPQALSYLINEHYHVVFLDCVLKDKNGVELSSRIKEILGDSVQIIMMSGIINLKTLSSYESLELFDFIPKPLSETTIDLNLKKIKELYIYGKHDNILIKFFKDKVSQIETLKYLISLKKAFGYEFFLYLSKILSTKDHIKLEFALDNEVREITFNKGYFVDYKYKNSSLFIERLLSNGLITPEEAKTIENKSEEEGVEYLVSHFILSPDQVITFKYDLFLETFKNIHPESEISLNAQMVLEKKETSSIILTQNEYANIIFLCLKQNFNDKIAPLFDENLMKKHLVFKEKKKVKNYIPEVTPIIEQLKPEIQLADIYKEHAQDKNLFCIYILYILLKGEVCILDEEEFNYSFLYERYIQLQNFFNQTDKNQIFYIISGNNSNYKLTHKKQKEIYSHFLKKNHPDIISKYKVSQKVLNQVDKTVRTFRKIYEEVTDPNLKIETQKKEKEETFKKAILMTEHKKLLEKYLQEKNYKSALNLFEMTPYEEVEKDIEWKMLTIWLYLKTNKNKKETMNLISSIQKHKKELEKNKIYYYLMGLNYLDRKNYIKAQQSFKISQKLDYSFKPNYEEIKKCTILTLKDKNSSKTISLVLTSWLNKLTNKKDAG